MIEGLSWRGQVGLGYRVPTFNDLFWVPGGNLFLLPEKSTSYETGISFQRQTLELTAGIYFNDIDNWIQWIPNEGIWSPQNIREVNTYGLEFKAEGTRTLNKTIISAIGNYEFVRSTDLTLEDTSNQLPYTPKHQATLSLNVNHQKLSGTILLDYTGKRFSSISNRPTDELPPFLLTDISVAYPILPNLTASASIRNILDIDYQNIRNLAMPGRNFKLDLTFKR